MGRIAERVGNYELQQLIGTGSFGQVVLGLHVRTGDCVAIKVLPTQGAHAIMQRRIASEVSTMEKAHDGCPYILQLHDVFFDTQNIYLIVEYAGGGELFKSCFKSIDDPHTDVGLPSREVRAREFFQQLVLGLHWCHKQGVAHRDLKPQNLLLSRDGVLKIADFGLAASFNPDTSLRHSTRSLRQTMCGSPLYMAPEVNIIDTTALFASEHGIQFARFAHPPCVCVCACSLPCELVDALSAHRRVIQRHCY